MRDNAPEFMQAHLAQRAEGSCDAISNGLRLTVMIGDTSLYDIFPTTKKRLYWPEAAHPVGHVRHPVTPAMFHAERAHDGVLSAAKDAVLQAFQEVLHG